MFRRRTSETLRRLCPVMKLELTGMEDPALALPLTGLEEGEEAGLTALTSTTPALLLQSPEDDSQCFYGLVSQSSGQF